MTLHRLVAGPTVYICDECIKLCNDIIAEEVERDVAHETRREAGGLSAPEP